MISEIVKFKEVRSTQDAARQLIARNQELAVTALRQKAGRGRHGRYWHSPSGGLYVSFLLFPRSRPEALPLLACLAVIKMLEKYGCTRPLILWPNDVLINEKKVCGILCEKFKNAYICGIGLNVNIDEFTDELPNATSMLLDRKKTFDLDEITNTLIRGFNSLYSEYSQHGLEIQQAYHYISGIGETVEIVTSQGREQGIVHGVDNDWAILIRDDHGAIRKYYCGEVRKLKW
jgi:BirA family biotin operon repressor/biotin-[acetyl-CoA-carboxylase] ligase